VNPAQGDVIHRVIIRAEGEEQTVAALQTVRDTLSATNATASPLTAIRQQADNDYTAIVRAANDAYDQTAAAAQASADKQTTALKEVADTAKQQSSGSFSLQSTRSLAGTAGGLLATVGGSQAASAVSSVLGLTTALGPLGIALGAGTLALKAVTDQEQARAKAAQDSADKLKQIATGEAGGTTASITADIEKQKAYRDALQASQDKLKEQTTLIQGIKDAYASGAIGVKEYEQTLTIAGGEINKITGDTGSAADAVDNLSAVLVDNQKNIDATSAEITSNSIVLQSQAVANNDARAAQEELSKALVDGANKSIQYDHLTAAARQEKIASDQRDIETLNALIGSSALTTDAEKNLTDQRNALTQEITSLTAISTSYADQLEREQAAKDAATKAGQSYLDTVTKEVDVQQQITDLRQQEAQVRQDANAREIDIQRKATDQASQILTESGKQQAQIIAKTQQNIAQIERDSGIALANDRYNLNALQYYLDEQKKQQQEASQQQTEQDQITSVRDNQAKQLNALKSSTTDQLRTVQQGEDQKLETLDRSLQQQQIDLQNLLAAEHALTNTYGIGIAGSFESMLQSIESTTKTYAQRIAAGFQSAINALAQPGANSPFPTHSQAIDLFDSRLAQTLIPAYEKVRGNTHVG
jgi:hypothetical protein